MAAITATTVSSPKSGGSILRTYGTSTANQADTLSSPAVDVGGSKRLSSVLVHYSAAPTHSGVTITLKSGIGATYDTLLVTSAANAQDVVYLPDNGDLWYGTSDYIQVSCPAGGAGITSRITIYEEQN